MGLLTPDLYYVDVHAIDLDDVRRRGVRGLLLDLDNTLLPRDTDTVPARVADWLAALPAVGLGACLVSNNWHGHAVTTAEKLGLAIVPKALKPLPHGFRAGMRLLGTDACGTAVIGDQLFTDVLGGNLAGCTTVLVCPQSETDLPHTLLLRHVERLILSRRRPLS